MVEAMYERSPAYFKQFQNNFRFFVSEEKPSSMFARNYAVCMHFKNDYCEVLPSNHYHVLFDVSDVSTEIMKRNKLCSSLFVHNLQNFFFKRDHSGNKWRDFRKTKTSCGIQRFSTADKRRSNRHSEAFTKFEQCPEQKSPSKWNCCLQISG